MIREVVDLSMVVSIVVYMAVSVVVSRVVVSMSDDEVIISVLAGFVKASVLIYKQEDLRKELWYAHNIVIST